MPASDRFAGLSEALTQSPATHGFDAYAARSDTVELSQVTRAVYTGSGGTMKVTMASGDVITLAGVPAGALLPIRIRQLWSSVTDVTDAIGLY